MAISSINYGRISAMSPKVRCISSNYSTATPSKRARILREMDEQERVMSLTPKERTQEIEEYNRKLINPW